MFTSSVVTQEFIQKLQTMAMVEAALKSSSIPLFQRGKFRWQDSNPSLGNFGKEGKGRFLGGVRGNYVANFWVRTLARRAN